MDKGLDLPAIYSPLNADEVWVIRTKYSFCILEPPLGWLTYEDHFKKPTGPEDENVHGCARAVNSLEPISLMFFKGAAKAVPTAPPTNTPQILQTTDKNDDFGDGIIGGAIVLGMILIIYLCHSCYIRFCRNRRDNAGAILNLPNMVQLPSQFPIGPPFLHKDDGITRGVGRIF